MLELRDFCRTDDYPSQCCTEPLTGCPATCADTCDATCPHSCQNTCKWPICDK